MKHRICLLCIAMLPTLRLSAGNPQSINPSPAIQTPARGSTVEFDTFRLISERNIFDPYRTARGAHADDNPPPRGDTISLVGTMHYEKGLFAFFNGSAPTFQKTLHEGETIADYTVAHIGQNSVELTRADQHLTLTIGQQLRRPTGGDWAPVTPEAIRRETETRHTSAPVETSPSAPPATSAVPPDASDVLKRLIEQRQKQLKP